MHKGMGELPYSFAFMTEWLESRRVGVNRDYLSKILLQCKCEDLHKLITRTYCASLT